MACGLKEQFSKSQVGAARTYVLSDRRGCAIFLMFSRYAAVRSRHDFIPNKLAFPLQWRIVFNETTIECVIIIFRGKCKSGIAPVFVPRFVSRVTSVCNAICVESDKKLK